MLFTKNKKHIIEDHVAEYLNMARVCLDSCEECFNEFYNTPTPDAALYKRLVGTVHKEESKCDDKRHEIEYMMYNKSLIPESRGDILGLLETTDCLPNKAESILRELYKSNLTLPDPFKERFNNLFQINIKAAQTALKVVRKYFNKPERISDLEKEVDSLESQSDVLQMNLERDIILSDLPDLQKILLKDFSHKIGLLSDMAENLGARVKLLSVKTVF